MIRKLRLGEIIRGGDFATEDDSSNGVRSILANIPFGNKVNQMDLFICPIYREIPDRLGIKDLKVEILHDVIEFEIESWEICLREHLDKDQARKIALWLLEVAEYIEAEGAIE